MGCFGPFEDLLRRRVIIVRAAIAMLAGLSPCAALSQEASLTTKFYQSLEPEFRAQYEKFLAGVEVEKARKAKAGEPAATLLEQKLGTRGAKTLIYNTAVIKALCAEQVGLPVKDESAFERDYKSCITDRMIEVLKFMKLAGYVDSLPPLKSTRCEMKSRDYKNEIRFTPYDFLLSDGGLDLPMMDYKALNACLLSDHD